MFNRYQPESTASYILADHSIAIIGNDGMEKLITPFNDLFRQSNPDIRFTITMRGSSTAIPALITGVSIFAPMSRDPWAGDRAAFRAVRGYDPTPVRLGYTGHGPRPGAKTPPAIYVHKDNPLPGLSMDQLRGVLTSGSPEGDLMLWDQLGIKGKWAGRRIHVYGLRDNGKYASGLREGHLCGRNYVAHYEPFIDRSSVIRALSEDPFGIGTIGWFEAAKVSNSVRVVGLSAETGNEFHTPNLSDVAAGSYPLSSFVSIYLDLPPGQRLDSLIKDYLRLALSDKGQKIVAAQTHEPDGYVPLSRQHLEDERRKLEML
ncbi:MULTISPECIES: PstS family phosphate ABC transporter substrate-binding protein [Paraliobacillus]|uniref:PstS family phosphate ABC transporter substrate-binding protein n=1 Tax=Paraliobacillus TaxID=200903 RepID=UPI000DD4AE0D|nr:MULTISPECIES: substrate-binding domain-containing protein [Paraliobacillus]